MIVKIVKTNLNLKFKTFVNVKAEFTGGEVSG